MGKVGRRMQTTSCTPIHTKTRMISPTSDVMHRKVHPYRLQKCISIEFYIISYYIILYLYILYYIILYLYILYYIILYYIILYYIYTLYIYIITYIYIPWTSLNRNWDGNINKPNMPGLWVVLPETPCSKLLQRPDGQGGLPSKLPFLTTED